MSMLPRYLRPIPATRRSYSFFSSKSGGGRYFNSTKPTKVVPTTTSKGTARVDTAAPDGTTSKASDDAASASPVTPEQPSMPAPPVVPPVHFVSPFFGHPQLSAQDLKLHQFFSLHRPLSLYQSSASLFESPSSAYDITGEARREAMPQASDAEMHDFDNIPEASPEADADAARQLSRALVMNRIGSTISFDEALARLGLDINEGRVGAEGIVVDMDSTKRKRRKKMKKHKCVHTFSYSS
ncbi:hypothetical protein DENSPDRAFT_596001 [Dentipellis sp. KUC8613]|nr:hypothetical protein DENSPDRAFT_596001 [Dentipellis sp. KUC8613]